MEALDLGRVLAIAKEVGIATFTVVVSAYFALNLLQLLRDRLKSSDTRWDDLIEVAQEQLKVQREGNTTITKLTLQMQAGFSEFDRRIETLQSKIDQLDEQIKHLLMLVGEEKADG